MPPIITAIATRDARFKLGDGEGTDAVHSESVYAYAMAILKTDTNELLGSGLAFTLGKGLSSYRNPSQATGGPKYRQRHVGIWQGVSVDC